MLCALTVDARGRVERFHVVVRAPDTKERERELQAHVARLETLGSNSDEFVIIHVRNDKPI